MTHDLPQVNFGTYKLTGPECYAAVRAAIDAGYRGIDTASIYRNEEVVGKAMKDSGQTVFVTTKINPMEMGYENAYAASTACLERLGLKKVDLLLIHWPAKAKLAPYSEDHRKIRIDTWRALEKLRAEGKSRFIGVSNFTIEHIQQLFDDGAIVKPYVNQVELHVHLQQRQLREFCNTHGIRLQAYSPLGSAGTPVLKELQVQHNNPLTYALKAAQSLSDSVVIKSASRDHITENLRILNEPIEISLNELETLERERHFCWDPNIVK